MLTLDVFYTQHRFTPRPTPVFARSVAWGRHGQLLRFAELCVMPVRLPSQCHCYVPSVQAPTYLDLGPWFLLHERCTNYQYGKSIHPSIPVYVVVQTFFVSVVMLFQFDVICLFCGLFVHVPVLLHYRTQYTRDTSVIGLLVAQVVFAGLRLTTRYVLSQLLSAFQHFSQRTQVHLSGSSIPQKVCEKNVNFLAFYC